MELDAVTLLQRYKVMPPDAFPVLTHLRFGDDGQPRELAGDEERDRDANMRRIAAAVMIAQAPWLMPLMQAAGAVLITVPGRLMYVLPSAPRELIELPGLGAVVDAVSEREAAGELH